MKNSRKLAVAEILKWKKANKGPKINSSNSCKDVYRHTYSHIKWKWKEEIVIVHVAKETLT